MEGAAPGLFPSRDREGSPVERVGFSRARPVPQTAQVPVGVGGQFGGLRFVAVPRSRGGGINPGWINQGPSAVPRELTARERAPRSLRSGRPRRPPPPASFPSLPCLPNRPGVSRLFTFRRSLGLDCPPAGSSEAFRDTGRSLQRLHLDPSLFPPPFPACPSPTPPCAALGVLSLQQSQGATPEGFELPGAQGSGQRPEGPASGPAAHAIWGFSHVEPEARTAPGNPRPPHPRPAQVPWRYPPQGTVYPLLWGRRFH